MASSHDPVPYWIDTTEFTRTGQRLSVSTPLARLGRMADLLTDQEGPLEWTLVGERSRRADGGFDAHLGLHFSGMVRMRCVRCLEPVEIRIEDDRHFKLVVTESIAEREDAQTDDFDLLVGSAQFDVLGLLEDEAIMALPLAPRHVECSPPGPTSASTQAGGGQTGQDEAEQDARPNPFAVLAGLKTRRSDDDDQN